MKRKRILLCILCSVLLLFSMSALTAYAHPGRLDSNGGHNDNINGGYHYHSGNSNDDYIESSDSPSIIDHYTAVYLVFLFFLLLILFYILIKLRPSRSGSKSTSLISNIPDLRKGMSNELLESVRFDSNVLYTPKPILKTETPPDYIRSAISRQFIPHYIPIYLWECVDVLEYHTGYYISFHTLSYLWAAYFYVFAKSIRSQSIVDELYMNFSKDARSYFGNRISGVHPYITLANSYKRIAPVLNASKIDPRTIEGRNQLWELISEWVYFPDDCKDAARKKFCLDCITIRFFVAKLYDIDYPIPSSHSSEASSDSEMPTN